MVRLPAVVTASLAQRVTWMGIWLLCGRRSIVSNNGFSFTCITAARAFSSQNIPLRSILTRGGGGEGGGGIAEKSHFQLFLAQNQDDEEERIPATGWNHNTPSKPEFWQSANGDNTSSTPQSQSQSTPNEAEGSAKSTRTGWLHNTKSKSKQNSNGETTGQVSGDGSSTKKGNGISKAQDRLKQAMLQQEQNHRIVSPPTFHACGGGRQIVVTEHRLSVPLVHGTKDPRVDLAFSIVEEIKDDTSMRWFQTLNDMPPQKRAMAYITKAALKNADDMMVYLQGGPGFGSPTPVVGLSFAGEAGWGAKALGTFKRIVLMDQRGTGKSSPITKQILEKKFPDLFIFDDKYDANVDLQEAYPEEFPRFHSSLNEAASYMTQFRADNIVQDAEYLRDALMLPKEPGSDPPGPRPWGGALGQSFGGFCMMTYLSNVDHPPQVCLITGGIAPMLTPAYEAYSSLWDRVRERSLMYYDMYPGDVALVKRIVQTLLTEPATLPSGGKLTARRFLQYGMSLGGSPSSFASMHSVFSSAFLDEESNELSRSFVKYFDSAQPFDDNPIYFWLHESIYADGPKSSPTNWVAERAYLDKPPELFDYQLTSKNEDDSTPVLFFGEMVWPWMSEDYAECAGTGCTVLANMLAIKDDWGPLYDAERMRKALDPNTGVSRCAASAYYGDMYVDFDCVMKVTARGGPLEHCRVYVTNEYQHSGLRDDGAAIFSKLYGMATGSVRTPS